MIIDKVHNALYKVYNTLEQLAMYNIYYWWYMTYNFDKISILPSFNSPTVPLLGWQQVWRLQSGSFRPVTSLGGHSREQTPLSEYSIWTVLEWMPMLWRKPLICSPTKWWYSLERTPFSSGSTSTWPVAMILLHKTHTYDVQLSF